MKKLIFLIAFVLIPSLCLGGGIVGKVVPYKIEQTPTVGAIPRADADGDIDAWVASSNSTSLSDISTEAPSDGDLRQYNATSGEWEPVSDSSFFQVQ